MKKICYILLLCIFVNMGIPLANNTVHASVDENRDIALLNYENYSATIERIEGNDCEIKFEVNELGKKYVIAIDSAHNKVTINDTQSYSIEVFEQAVKEQNSYIKDGFNTRSGVGTDLVSILNKYPSVRCATCGKYSPNSAPTSGYRTGNTSPKLISQRVEVGFTAGCIALAIGALGIQGAFGVVGGLTTQSATKLMSKAVGFGYAVGTEFNVWYKNTVAYHSTCPKAAYSMRKFYADSNGALDLETSSTLYYYFIKPY